MNAKIASLLSGLPLVMSAAAFAGNGKQDLDMFVDRREIDAYNGFVFTPIIARFEAAGIKYKLTVPIVQFTSSASAGFYTDRALNLDRASGPMTYAELGDVTLRASRELWRSKRLGVTADMRGKFTFATGSVDKDIGDGRAQGELLLDLSKRLGPIELLAGVGYAVRRSYTEDAAANGYSSYLGASLNVGARRSIDASYEYRQGAELGDPPEKELALGLTFRSRGNWMLRSYGSLTREGEDRDTEFGFTLSKNW